MKKETVKEPLIHITKRTDITVRKKILIRVIAFLSAFLLCGLLSMILIPKISENPSRIFEFYKCFIDGNFKTSTTVWQTLVNIAVLLCISLAVTPAFRMKFWNTGAEGQTLVGVLVASGLSYHLGGKMSEGLLLILMFVGALLAGAVWGVIPAVFKAFWNTNETLFTLMMNYIATNLVAFCLSVWIKDGSMVMPRLEYGILPSFLSQYFTTILLVIALTVLLYIYLNYSKHGYEISVVGESINTAKYVGINVKKVMIRTMALSGALCGFCGFLISAGVSHGLSADSVGGQGFTAIMVSWLAKFSPIFMLLTSTLITFLQGGAGEISTVFDSTKSVSDIFIGLVLFFIIGCEFFLSYKVHFRKKKPVDALPTEAKKSTEEATKS